MRDRVPVVFNDWLLGLAVFNLPRPVGGVPHLVWVWVGPVRCAALLVVWD